MMCFVARVRRAVQRGLAAQGSLCWSLIKKEVQT